MIVHFKQNIYQPGNQLLDLINSEIDILYSKVLNFIPSEDIDDLPESTIQALKSMAGTQHIASSDTFIFLQKSAQITQRLYSVMQGSKHRSGVTDEVRSYVTTVLSIFKGVLSQEAL